MRAKQLIVHHSAGPRSQTPEAIRRFHMESRGWSDVGYHWLVDQAGEVHAGRDPSLLGAHAPPNAGRLGVCVIGDNTDPAEAWTPLQWQALSDLIAAVRLIWPGIEVMGHKDTGRQTACPGLEWAEIERGIRA